MRALIVMAVLLAAPAGAADLEPVSQSLAAVHAETLQLNENHGVGPAMTGAKRALRVWIEAQLKGLPQEGNEAGLAQRLNTALHDSNLECDTPKDPDGKRCDSRDGFFNAKGYAGPITIERRDLYRYLVVTTRVGFNCGYDESAYIYVWRTGGWKLLLQSEQDDYRNKHYAPQNFVTIELSPANIGWNEDTKTPPLVVTQGYSPWCSSNWQMLYTRLWRASFTQPSPPPLLDRADELFIGDAPAIAKASITQRDVLMEWHGNSIDGDKLVRENVAHYLIGAGDKLERVAPVALDPAGFVEEWLMRPWQEAKAWSEKPAAMQVWHQRLHSDYKFGEFGGPPSRCRADPTLWQTSFAENVGGDKEYRLGPARYYVVRWTAPYRFSMVEIRNTAASGCDIKDSMHDDLGTLFPLQDWR
jgi:hypothetical protein